MGDEETFDMQHFFALRKKKRNPREKLDFREQIFYNKVCKTMPNAEDINSASYESQEGVDGDFFKSMMADSTPKKRTAMSPKPSRSKPRASNVPVDTKHLPARDTVDPFGNPMYSANRFGEDLPRRLAGCSVLSDHDAPSDFFILAPLLLILMLVFFMYRKPIQNYFSGSSPAKPSHGGLRNIRKKAPIRHF